MTKRVMVLSVLLLIGSLSVTAQDRERALNIGLKGGVTLPNVFLTQETLTQEDLDATTFLRYTGGVAVQFFVEKNFGLQVELNYTERGWKQNFGSRANPNPPEVYEVELDYIELPILAHAYLGRKNLRLFLNAGVYVAYLFDHKVTRTAVEEDDERIDQLYDARFQNNMDLGVRGGGGFEIVTRAGIFQVEGSFSWGFISVLDKDLAEIPNTIQNLTPAVTFGYYVPF